ncbi:PREDICTED: 1-acyl-sn-glycerol-3-phosphate acyltransferase PLS1-like isoform X2 [Populus euphratica]|uniref:1-acylglycerol-3-phosphate O-acyltransferase n=1 Tax=Populus euphratica TaxID=75702 RepID=A0AAJ6UA90_POPEU|nr:PREDICTED: 1-acyl-sn-glycerol-3-phosphate acyltransferase PLS1-like isoform X2 [Populus euphratica]
MENLATVVLFLPLGMVFCLTGIAINIIQAACFLIIWPLSKNTYRRIVGAVTEIFFLVMTFLVNWFAGLEVHLHTDLETYELIGKENALVMPNHICDVDVLMMWLLAERFNCLRGVLMVMKKSSKYLPIYGWANWFNGAVFLDRNWAKDEGKLKSSFRELKDFPGSFWLTIFVEGTRMTPDKLLAAQEFAISKGLPVPRNVLIPRTKYTRPFLSAVYDVTVAVPKGHPIPSLKRFLKRQTSVVHFHIKRYATKGLPESDEGVAQWCKDRFVVKDAMLEEFRANDTFEGKEIRDFRIPPKKSLIVFIFLSCICSIGAIMLIQRFSLLSNWKGISSLAFAVAFDAILIYTFIEYTKLPEQRKVQATNGQVVKLH